KDGVDELNIFENNGYSEIFWFKTNSGCEPPIVNYDIHDYQLDLTWNSIENTNEYEVQFCNKYESTGELRKYLTNNTNYTFFSLQLGATYQYRVGAKCTNGNFIYSNVYEFTMPETDTARQANCGVLPEVDFSNQNPLQELKVGDVFMASDYPVTVTKIAGGNGIFTGEGWVMLRWIFNVRVAVEFENININTDKRAINGIINFKYNKDWKNIGNLDNPSGNDESGGIKIDITVSFVIPPNPEFEYNDNAGVLMIYDLSGIPHYVDLPKNNEGKVVFSVTIKDSDGNIYEVNEETYIDENGNEQTKIVINEVEEENIMQTGYLQSDTLSKYFLINNDHINEKIASGKEIYICQNSEPVNISFYSKQDSIIKKNIVQWNYLNNNITDSIITVEVNSIGIITITASIDSVNYFIKLKVYKAPTVNFNVTGFDGSFGFDNYVNQYNPHRNDLGKEDHLILLNDTDIIYVPNISLLQNQSNVIVTISFSNYQEMQKDSLLNFIKIYSANGMVKLNGKDTLKISRNQLTSNYNLIIVTNDVTISYDSIMIKTSYNKTIGKLNVFSQQPIEKELLLIHIQTDSISASDNFAPYITSITNRLNDKSYNQAFVKWDVTTASIPYVDIKNNIKLLKQDSILKAECKNMTSKEALFRAADLLVKIYGITYSNDKYVGFIVSDSIIANIPNNGIFVFDGIGLSFGQNLFMIANDNYDAQIITHELGHCLKLHHPFGTENKINDEGFQRQSIQSGSTENIMDYDKTRMHTLWLWQWIIMNNNIKYYNR
ncbi:MAG: fibronectin type III domain-containing protein, partial [Prevotellaceae bacterium]|nr:fibronectin type III domain-containing protein [Prevotellaceae bacterium]